MPVLQKSFLSLVSASLRVNRKLPFSKGVCDLEDSWITSWILLMNTHSTSDKNKLIVNSSYTHAINENRAFLFCLYTTRLVQWRHSAATYHWWKASIWGMAAFLLLTTQSEYERSFLQDLHPGLPCTVKLLDSSLRERAHRPLFLNASHRGASSQ